MAKSGRSSMKKQAKRSKPVSNSSRCDLIFPVGRTTRYLKHGRYASQVGIGAGIFAAAALEYLAN